MELSPEIVNENPAFAGINSLAVRPGNIVVPCEGWLLALSGPPDQGDFAASALDPPTDSGLRFRLGADQSVRLGSRIRVSAESRSTAWRATVKLRAVPESTASARLDAGYLARIDHTGAWLFDFQVLGETSLDGDWSELTTSFAFDPSTKGPALGRTWGSRLLNLVRRTPHVQDAQLLFVLSFGGPGTIEIESCTIEDERPMTAPRAAPSPSSARPHVAHSRTGIGEQARIVAILDGRILGWLGPGLTEGEAAIFVDGERVASIPAGRLSGAESALLHVRPGQGFSAPIPAHLLDGKRHVVEVRDDAGRGLPGNFPSNLVLGDVLHIAEPVEAQRAGAHSDG
jgi:hypothetical protein